MYYSNEFRVQRVNKILIIVLYKFWTESRGLLDNNPASYSGGSWFKSWLPCQDFSGFPQSLQMNTGTVPYIRQGPLPSKSFPIHHSLVII
jgi:hypothetical protein